MACDNTDVVALSRILLLVKLAELCAISASMILDRADERFSTELPIVSVVVVSLFCKAPRLALKPLTITEAASMSSIALVAPSFVEKSRLSTPRFDSVALVSEAS